MILWPMEPVQTAARRRVALSSCISSMDLRESVTREDAPPLLQRMAMQKLQPAASSKTGFADKSPS